MSRWYVYALLKYATDQSDPASKALYIGKGCGQRKDQHKKEVRRSLLADKKKQASNPKKVAALADLLHRGADVVAVRLGRSYETEHDAFVAEQMLISLINRQRAETRSEPLLNAVAGHGGEEHSDDDGLIDLDELFAFTQTEDLVLPLKGGNRYGILVKAANEASYATPRTLTSPFLDKYGEPVPGIVRASLGTARNDRRPWDPHAPWSDVEARRRAARFWEFAVDRVVSWVGGADDRPTVCALGVRHGGKTTVRYVWAIDYEQPWQRFNGTWGIPLGKTLERRQTCLLGKALYEKIPVGNQSKRQLLFGRNKGCKTFRYKETGSIGAQ